MTSKKEAGQVFTPQPLVEYILNVAGYSSAHILRRHIIDNSCGDGAFLCQIVDRYCKEFFLQSDNRTQLANELSTYIHGIELDPVAYEQCRRRLIEQVAKWELPPIDWDIVQDDALQVLKFNNKMDFVIGNPPYVRVHHLNDKYKSVKNFTFAEKGMTDLFLVFFEVGFRMLNTNGKLCYITPSSWLHSVAGTSLRKYIFAQKHLQHLIDLEHQQVFEGATTYTLISFFDTSKRTTHFSYSVYNPQESFPCKPTQLSFEEAFIRTELYLGSPIDLLLLRKIRQGVYGHYAVVKNGFATLNDNFFIQDTLPFKEHTIPIIKASTGKWRTAFFPYTHIGKPLSLSALCKNKDIATFLEKGRLSLLKGVSEKDSPEWYLYGRTQALKDVHKQKYAINTCIKDIESVKLNAVPAGAGIYSGLYILTAYPGHYLLSILRCQTFINYIKLLKKYKSGGYYTFSSKDLELYLNYFLHPKNNEHAEAEQHQVLGGYLPFI